MRRADAGDRVVRVTLKNLSSEDKSEKAVYAKLQPSEGTLPLSIHNVGAKRGDRIEVTGASKNTAQDFVNDFEKRKAKELRNVKISLEGGNLRLEVDGKEFQGKSCEQDALRLMRYLKVRVEPFQRDFRFWDDGEKITAKFGDSWTIQSFSANDKGLGIRYQMGSRTINSNFLSPSDETVLNGDYLRPEEISSRMRILSQPDIFEGVLAFENDSELHSYLYGRLTQATHMSLSMYNEERGNLGEDMGITLLKNCGLAEVKMHPFAKGTEGRGSHKRGTDVLMRDNHDRLVLFEIKWRIDPDIAMKDGLEESRKRQMSETEYKGETISGAYVAVLDYSLKSRRGVLRVERAW